ncbi:MAG: D-glycero-beta-D-manno-heptose 1-phosphate adenylyltransferase [Leptospirales bacterium]
MLPEPMAPFPGTGQKLISRDNLPEIIRNVRQAGKKIVFTNGCFDLVHAGHIEVLEKARLQGDFLVVALNTDLSVQSLKGPNRPLVPERRRARVISALCCVDAVTLFDEPTPYELIALLEPDVLVKGGDWAPDRIVGSDIVLKKGGRVLSIPLLPDSSTTLIIERILERYRIEGPSGHPS